MLLALLPTQVLASLSEFLMAHSTISLFMTGDRRLQMLLSQVGVVRSLKIGSQVVGNVPFPSCLGYLSHLSELHLVLFTSLKNTITDFSFSKIPRGVQTLHLYFEGVKNHFEQLNTSSSDALALCDILPNLCSLSAPLELILPIKDGLQKSLSKLRHLCVDSWDTGVPLPPKITSIVSNIVIHNDSEHVKIPSTLIEFFSAKLEGNLVTLLPLLPSGLQQVNFTSNPWYFGSSVNYPFGQWPQGLKKLQARTISFSTACFTHLWPPSLTELTIPCVPIDMWDFFPKTLLKLSLNRCQIMFPVTIADIKRGLNSLPPLLTSFGLSSPRSLDIEEKLSLPRNLTELLMENVALSPNCVSNLPSSLKHLSTLFADGEMIKMLPRGLEELHIRYLRLCNKSIKNLPPQLELLKASCSLPSDAGHYFNRYMNQIFAHNVEYDRVLDGEKLLQKKPSFPPSMTKISLSSLEKLNKSILPLLLPTNLRDITLLETEFGEDIEIPNLSRFLVSLEMTSATHLTGRCFKHLPRNMLFLSLDTISDVQDQEIADLPPSLTHCGLYSVKTLTNDSIPLFPRSLENLYVVESTAITKECVPNLPPRLWIAPFEDSFLGPTFYISKCQLIDK
jgi:hypothetical protein